SADLFSSAGDVGGVDWGDRLCAGSCGVGFGVAGDAEIGGGGGGDGYAGGPGVLGGARGVFCAGDAGVDAGGDWILFICDIQRVFWAGDWGVAGDEAQSAAGGA